jgi:RNA polymerase sigma-70 factor (ECF subfamily)
MEKHPPPETPGLQDRRPVEALVSGHRRFLAFLKGRVGDEAVAEDILQAAYVKGLERAHQIRDSESVVAWFYRLLRNAVADHYRQQGAEARALQQFGSEQETSADPDLHAQVCACIHDALKTMQESYAEAVRRVDLEETPVDDYARQQAISQNNVWVRLHRGRKALAKRLTQLCGVCATHGCLDCHCHR